MVVVRVLRGASSKWRSRLSSGIHIWPDIGGGVRVEKITIRECKKGECK